MGYRGLISVGIGLVNLAHGMHPAQGLLADIELTRIIGI
jgi:hypothetical protein